MSLASLKALAEKELLGQEGITGVSVVNGKLRVYVEHNSLEEVVPTEIMGYPVEKFVTGKIVALSMLYYFNSPNMPYIAAKASLQPYRTERIRPVPGGVSIGHPSITAGTNGVNLNFLGYKLGLSNNHVLAAASTDRSPNASLGDPIYQPGPYDGGSPQDAVGELFDYAPLNETAYNVIDAAVWSPYNISDLDPQILDIGVPQGVSEAVINTTVQKSGRTTGYNTGLVQDVNATIKVNYGNIDINFQNQIVTTKMAEGGDSGSALLNMNNRLVGLLFAGSDYVTCHNHIANVLNILNLQGGGGQVPPQNRKELLLKGLAPLILGSVVMSTQERR